jgi:hypothetical protein
MNYLDAFVPVARPLFVVPMQGTTLPIAVIGFHDGQPVMFDWATGSLRLVADHLKQHGWSMQRARWFTDYDHAETVGCDMLCWWNDHIGPMSSRRPGTK